MSEGLTIGAVIESAEALGFSLSPDEAEIYRQRLERQLATIETVIGIDETSPRPSLRRDKGRRPCRQDDPFNAWMWKCRIHESEEGLLAGKTVSFKDHIAVGGIPCSFGARELEGFVPDFDATIVERVLRAGFALQQAIA